MVLAQRFKGNLFNNLLVNRGFILDFLDNRLGDGIGDGGRGSKMVVSQRMSQRIARIDQQEKY